MTTAILPNVLIVGHLPAWLVDELSGLCRDCDCQFADSLTQAIGVANPDLIVVYQSYFNEFHSDDIDRIIGQFPFARWVIGYNPWCESLGQSDKVWPFAWIVPVRHMKTRLFAELQNFDRSEPLVPALSSRDEAFAKIDMRVVESGGWINERRVARVSCQDAPFRRTMLACLKAFGFELVEDDTADIHIVAIDQWDDVGRRKIETAIESTPRAQILVTCELLPEHARWEVALRQIATLSPLRFMQDLSHALHHPTERVA